MKVKEGFVLQKIAEENIVVPLSDNMDNMHCVINLNETGAFLWERLENDTTETALVKALLDEYDVDEAQALASVREFIGKIAEIGCLEK